MIVVVGLGVLGTRVLARLSEYESVLLIDYDTIEEKNIRRQYPPVALGMQKVYAAREYIRPDARVLHKHLDWSTVGVLHDASVVIDCTDNLLARYVINDYCAKHGIPWIHAGMSDHTGVVAAFVPDGPCFQCIYPQGRGETCSTDLDLNLAGKVAGIVIAELARLKATPKARFIRVSHDATGVLEMSRRTDCPTCLGTYNYLEPHEYYITYCTMAGCMSVKPVHAKRHDHGPGEDKIIDGMPVTIFGNGEIHFHRLANDDVLHELAEQIYRKQFRGTPPAQPVADKEKIKKGISP